MLPVFCGPQNLIGGKDMIQPSFMQVSLKSFHAGGILPLFQPLTV